MPDSEFKHKIGEKVTIGWDIGKKYYEYRGLNGKVINRSVMDGLNFYKIRVDRKQIGRKQVVRLHESYISSLLNLLD